MKHFLLVLILFGNISIVYAYNNLAETYPFLESKINNLKEKPSEQIVFIRKMIEKAKKDNNIQMLHRAYSLGSTYTRNSEQLKYGDSLLITAFKQNDSDIIGDCFLAKGTIYMNEERYQDALQNYVKGYEYIKKKNNPYLVHNAEFLIAQTKIYLGQYQEARDILTDVLSFYRNHHKKIDNTDYGLYYIYTLISYIDTNSRLSFFEENKLLIREGLNFINKNNYKDYTSYFVSLEGTDLFHQKKYDLAIEKLNEALKLYDDNWKHLTEIYYLGLSYWYKGDKNSALNYLLKINTEYKTTGKLDPQFRPAIELLINYYKEQGDTKKQLEFVDQLLELDKIYEKDFKYLYATLQKEYDIKDLKEKKLNLEDALLKERKIKIIIIALSAFVLTISVRLLYLSRKRQKYYKKLLTQMYGNEDTSKENEITENSKISEYNNINEVFDSSEISDINPLVIENILTFLNKFEKEKRFLQKDLSLHNLSQECGTNISYFSKVINYYKKDNFLSYINNLRLDYVVELWKTNPKTRHLRIQEISFKAGFSTAQSFSKNFKEKYQISPSYFLKRLENENNLELSSSI